MKKLITLKYVLGIALVSCVGESGIDPGQGSRSTGGFLMTYSISGHGTQTVTRAGVAPEEGEENVRDIVLLFFEKSDDRSGLFQDYIIITPPAGQSLKMNDPINISYQGKSLDAGTAYNILAVANMSAADYLENGTLEDWGGSWNNNTEYYVTERAIALAKGDGAITPDAILMSGSTSVDANQSKVELTFVRALVRFDVTSTISVKQDFDIVSVSIWNAYPKASVFDGSYLEYGDAVWRIKRFYGINNDANFFTDADGNPAIGDDGSPLIGDIKGGLYCFVNRVGGPEKNDTRTTCLILGIHDRLQAPGQVSYYRVNIHPDDSGQSLKRNNVYKLTVRAVLGPGKDTETEAYSGVNTELAYTINYWDLDDNGLVIHDQNSVLSIPVKTVRFGHDGGMNEYSIYTFTTLTTNPALTLSQQEYNVSGRINAHLDGNTLVVMADPLDPGEDDRTGMITLRYAGLTATMTVVQSASTDRYLTVTKPVEGLPIFPSAAGVSSGNFSVTASGPWTAKIYLDGFSFYQGQDKVELSQAEATDNKFRIWTSSPNTDTKARQGVLIVSLDDDPEKFSAAIVFSQKAPGGISVSPEGELIFNGSGDALTTDRIDVFPSYEDNDPADPRYMLDDWNIKLLDHNSINDYSGTRFTATVVQKTLSTNSSPGTAGMNLIHVVANGPNNGAQARATLRIYLVNDDSKFTDITLTQRPRTLTLDPGSVPAIPVTGGQTPLITVEGDASMKWSAVVETRSGTASDGRELVNHEPTFLDQNGNSINMSSPQDMTTQFRVVMPKVYWPNREVPNLYVLIRVELLNPDGSPTGIKANALDVDQNSLISSGFRAWDVYTTGWNSITAGVYYTRFSLAIKAWPGFTYSGTYTSSGANATTYVNLGTQNLLNNGYDWTQIEEFRQEKDGVTVINADKRDALNSLNSSTGPLNKSGYTLINAGGGTSVLGNARVNDNVAFTRIYKFLMEYGGYIKAPQKATEAAHNGMITFLIDDVRTEAVDIPPTAVPIIMNNATGNTLMAIDPANRLVVMGEGQMFDTPGYYNVRNTYGHGYGFMCNFIHYLENASKYGSHFTDMLRDSLDEGGTNEPNPIPEIWSDIWGAGKWIAGPDTTEQ